MNSIRLTGTQNLPKEADNLRPEGSVQVVLEDNKYDDKCVSIRYNGIHIGYLKKGSEEQAAVYDDLINHRRVEAQVESYSYYDDKVGFNNDHIGKLQSVSINIQMHLGYIKDGEEYNSITKLLGTCNFGEQDRLDEWKCSHGSYEAYKKALHEKAEYGTKMHKLAEECLKAYRDGKEMPDYPPVVNFLNKYKPEILGIEEGVFDDELHVAGTYDALIKIGERVIALDWKTSSAVQIKHKIQISWYSKMKDADEGWVILLDMKTKQRYSVSKVTRNEIDNNYEIVRHLSAIQELLPEKYRL